MTAWQYYYFLYKIKAFSELDRREVYSQVFNNRLYFYGDIHYIHRWSLFARNHDDICRSYFLKKDNKWEKFISLGWKYIPRRIMPEEAYKLEGLSVEEPKPPVFDPNDESNWTEEEQKRLDEELKRKINEK